MKLTEKKVSQLIAHLNEHIKQYKELIDAGYVEYYKQVYILQDTLEYTLDLFDVEGNDDHQ